MSERLDRIEAILETVATHQARQADEIDTLIGAASNNETAIRELTANVQRTNADVTQLITATAESNQRFEVLRQEAISDRRELGQRFEALQQELAAAVAEGNQRFEILRHEAISDRRELCQRFDDAVNQMNRDRADNQQRFDEMTAQMNRDRAAQTEILQGLLLELSQMKGRIITLEQRAS